MAVGLLAPTALSGTWQMALDAALLERQQPLLRFYRWSQPTLSLGYHQRALEPSWLSWQQRGGAVVRRPSGGGAVLHGQDLCYALIWPSPRSSRQEAYRCICSWLQDAFAALGEPLQFGGQAAVIEPDCFARNTAADLVNACGHKRIGSAQRWRQGCLLQHGSIQLQPDNALWTALLGHPAPRLQPLGLATGELAEHLLQYARRHWTLPPQPQPLTADLLAEAGALLERYRLADDGSTATSPLASMPRTT